MKQKDLALIGVIIVISALVSLFISNALFGSSGSRQQAVETVQPITASGFPSANNPPKPDYFSGGYDPTQLIQIGPNNNSNPFSASSQ